MRSLLCALALVTGVTAATSALAERVVVDPPLVRRCRGGRVWSEVMKCAATLGQVKLERGLPGARLLSITTETHATSGLLLYVEARGEWRVAGHWHSYDNDFQVLGLSRVKAGKHTGYRIDIGQASRLVHVVDNISPVPAVLRTRRALHCSGHSHYCADVIVTCEVLVRGNAWYAFRGALSIAGSELRIEGDRSKAGPYCATASRMHLW